MQCYSASQYGSNGPLFGLRKQFTDFSGLSVAADLIGHGKEEGPF
jgi:hypothetical protein